MSENQLAVKESTTSVALTPEKVDRYNQITRNLVITDRNSVLNYGNELNSIVEQNSHAILEVAKSSDGNEITKLTHELRNKLEVINPAELKYSPFRNFLRKIPIVNLMVPSLTQLQNKYTSVEGDVVAIAKQFDKLALDSVKDNTDIEIHRQNVIEYIEQTDELIDAAIYKSEQLKNQLYEMQEHPDDYESYELTQVSNFIEALDRKIYSLRQTRFAFGLTVTELDITQNNNALVAETAQNFVHEVIPNWREQLSVALLMEKTQSRLQALAFAKETNESMLLNNAKLLKTNAIEAAKQSKEGIYKPETLDQASRLIIETLDKLDEIADNAANERRECTSKLMEIENRMNDARERVSRITEDVDYITGENKKLKELQ